MRQFWPYFDFIMKAVSITGSLEMEISSFPFMSINLRNPWWWNYAYFMQNWLFWTKQNFPSLTFFLCQLAQISQPFQGFLSGMIFQEAFSPWRKGHIEKLTPLLLLQLFEAMKQKWAYFSDSRSFWGRKQPLKSSTFDRAATSEKKL